MNTLREEIDELQERLFLLVMHPEATGQDKASLTLANISLSSIRERRKGRWPDRAPRSVVQSGQAQAPGSDWYLNWENEQEASHGRH